MLSKRNSIKNFYQEYKDINTRENDLDTITSEKTNCKHYND